MSLYSGVYRVTPRNVTDIANKNTGDPTGDIGFYLSRKSLVVECRDDITNQRCFLARDNIFAQSVVEVDGNFGGYRNKARDCQRPLFCTIHRYSM